MKLSLPRLLFWVIVCSSLTAKAQLGRSLYAGATLSSFRNDTLNSKGGTGFEIGYSVFAKYSDRLEWTSSISFFTVKRTGVTVYKVENDPNFNVETYTPTTTDFNTGQLNASYMLSYYAIPDQLALCGGFDMGFDFLSTFKHAEADAQLYRLKASTDVVTGSPYIEKKPIDEIKTPLFTYGPTFGVSYTYDERFVVYARYTMFLNTYFSKKDEMSETNSTEYTDMSKLNLLKVGLGYKFIPSPKDRRF